MSRNQFAELKNRVREFAERAKDEGYTQFRIEYHARTGHAPCVNLWLSNGEGQRKIFQAKPRDHGIRRLWPIARNMRYVLAELHLQEMTEQEEGS